MACPIPSCRITKLDEQMISCWICSTSYHSKCAQLAARTIDNLREDKGLRWCCEKCKHIDGEFFTFFKNCRARLDDISRDFDLISDRFKKYKNILDNSSNLDIVLQSPTENSRKRKKSKSNKNSSNNEIETISPTLVNTNNNIHDSETVVIPTNNAETAPLPIPPIIITPSHSNSLNTGTVVAPATVLTDTNSFFSPFNTPTNQSPAGSAPKPLRVLPPMKTIFAARFAPETTEDDIHFYIKSKLNANVDIKVSKLQFVERRNKSSFKIFVPEDIFDTVVNPEFWPYRAVVHEFVFRDRVARLPARPVEQSKN
ncbi:uncharacterized protein LOC142224977 [Haematobia irritans]|uniref:uncharacterized protein LOC142224977 n=1 Tax=Haematobia irritans TaxID=7368 RepID=UPI003F4FFB1F